MHANLIGLLRVAAFTDHAHGGRRILKLELSGDAGHTSALLVYANQQPDTARFFRIALHGFVQLGQLFAAFYISGKQHYAANRELRKGVFQLRAALGDAANARKILRAHKKQLADLLLQRHLPKQRVYARLRAALRLCSCSRRRKAKPGRQRQKHRQSAH